MEQDADGNAHLKVRVSAVPEGGKELFADPKHAYTRQLFAATPITDVDAIRARVERRKAARQAATA